MRSTSLKLINYHMHTSLIFTVFKDSQQATVWLFEWPNVLIIISKSTTLMPIYLHNYSERKYLVQRVLTIFAFVSLLLDIWRKRINCYGLTINHIIGVIWGSSAITIKTKAKVCKRFCNHDIRALLPAFLYLPHIFNWIVNIYSSDIWLQGSR